MPSGARRRGGIADRIFRGVGDVVVANAIEVASGLAEQAVGRVHPSLPAIIRARMLRPAPAPQKASAAPPPPAADREAVAEPMIEMRRGPDGRWEMP